MRKSIKDSIFVISTFLILFCILSNFFVNKVSADETNDASVSITTDNNSNTSDATVSVPVSSMRKAPVSINTYSDIVTESADTYDYSRVTTSSNNSSNNTLPTTTSAPTDSNMIVDNSNTNNNTNNTTNNNSNNNISNNETTTLENTEITNYVFIGDSRTVAMQSVIGEKANHTWSCKVAMGLKWLKSTGVPAVENKITSGTAVIILMGVNDLYNVNNYISYINEKSAEWRNKGAKTYFVSVNPINESTYSGFKNTKIEDFNNKIYSGLNNVSYIDTYNHLMTHSINFTSDGLHYKNSTSQEIYDLVIKGIKN